MSEPTLREQLSRIVCEAVWGKGSWPWNVATGYKVRHVTSEIVDRIVAVVASQPVTDAEATLREALGEAQTLIGLLRLALHENARERRSDFPAYVRFSRALQAAGYWDALEAARAARTETPVCTCETTERDGEFWSDPTCEVHAGR